MQRALCHVPLIIDNNIFLFVLFMDKSTVIFPLLEGYEKRCNDVVFCGSEGQQHVVFFPGDVQVSK